MNLSLGEKGHEDKKHTMGQCTRPPIETFILSDVEQTLR